jgi:hypothetical protein
MQHTPNCQTHYCISCSGGDPVWHGSPSKAIIQLIQAITYIDEELEQHHKKYYRNREGNWVRLNTSEAFAELNSILDSHR